MKRLDRIIHHPVFQQELERLEFYEKDRIYCRHNLEHLLAVARTAQILNLERQANIPQDVLYAASLLHDIGRACQYATGQPDRQPGVMLAEKTPKDAAFTPAQPNELLDCGQHHHGRPWGGTDLVSILSEADTRSRPCFSCLAAESCKWSMERRNLSLTI